MKPRYIALVALVVVGTAMASIGLVSAGHQPTNPDDVYIHEVNMTEMGSDAQICIEDMGENLNKVRLEGLTIHTNTTFYHDGDSGKVLIHVPRLRVPSPHKIVLFSNGENPTIENADDEGGGENCLLPGQGTMNRLVIGEYNINVGQIITPQGVTILTGPEAFDTAPEPGSGSATLSSGTGPVTGTDDPSPTDTEPVEGPQVSSTQSDPTDDTTQVTDDPVDDSVENTTDDANSVVEQVQRAVQDAIDSVAGDTAATDATNDTSTTTSTNTSGTADASGTDGGTVGAGLAGVTGILGLLGVLFGLIRHRSH